MNGSAPQQQEDCHKRTIQIRCSPRLPPQDQMISQKCIRPCLAIDLSPWTIPTIKIQKSFKVRPNVVKAGNLKQVCGLCYDKTSKISPNVLWHVKIRRNIFLILKVVAPILLFKVTRFYGTFRAKSKVHSNWNLRSNSFKARFTPVIRKSWNK